LLLTCNGYGPHCYDFQVLRNAKEKRIVVAAFPAHTSSLLQPLDVAVFGPWKRSWKKLVSTWMKENPGKTINRTSFPRMSRLAWEEGITIETIKAGFRATGIHPYNRDFVASVEAKLRVSSSLTRSPLPVIDDTERLEQLKGNLGLSPAKPKGIQQYLTVPQRTEEGSTKKRKQRENTSEPRELTSLSRMEMLEKQDEERRQTQKEKEERKQDRKRKREEKEVEKQEKKRQKGEQIQKEMPIRQLLMEKGYLKEGGTPTITMLDLFAKKNSLGRLGTTRADRVDHLLRIIAGEKERVWVL
jgi:hypothetical protein